VEVQEAWEEDLLVGHMRCYLTKLKIQDNGQGTVGRVNGRRRNSLAWGSPVSGAPRLRAPSPTPSTGKYRSLWSLIRREVIKRQLCE
jgi:hypothetical protein